MLTFEQFAPDELQSYLDATYDAYVRRRVESGDTEAEAEASATSSRERRAPGGLPAPGHHIGRLLEDDAPVGHLWVGPDGPDGRRWWVVKVEIDEAHRGRGLGREAMVLAEEVATAHGATSIGLNVFGGNDVARGLYASLGYAESTVTMRKELPDSARTSPAG